MQDTYWINQSTLDQLQEHYKHLKEVLLPNITREVERARNLGDLSENAEYQSAKDKQGRLNDTKLEIEHLFNNHVLIPDKLPTDRVRVGHKVTLRFAGEHTPQSYVLGTSVSHLLSESQGLGDILGLSNMSPQGPSGRAILGRKEGDLVSWHSPQGLRWGQILKIEQPGS